MRPRIRSDNQPFFAGQFCSGFAMVRCLKQNFMLHAMTWKQFGIAVFSAGLLYYLIILFKYYRREISAFCSGDKTVKPSPDVAARSDYSPVFGEAKVDEAEMNLVDSEDLEFAPEEYATGDNDKNKTLLLGGLADFMQELKTLIRITIEGEDSKDNFLSLFRLIASKYSQLLDGSFNQSIISYVLDCDLPFNISQNELEQTLNDLNNEE
jgi:hypothetical protein